MTFIYNADSEEFEEEHTYTLEELNEKAAQMSPEFLSARGEKETEEKCSLYIAMERGLYRPKGQQS